MNYIREEQQVQKMLGKRRLFSGKKKFIDNFEHFENFMKNLKVLIFIANDPKKLIEPS